MATSDRLTGEDRTATASKASRAPRQRRRGEDTSHAALMLTLADDTRSSALFSKVCFMARSRYGILPQDAEDIFHEAVATYIAIHARYPPQDNHFGLLVGIFHKKALEHLGSRERDGRITRRFVSRLRSDRPHVARGEDPKGPAVECVIRREDADLIRDAIETLTPDGREMLLSLAEGRATRLEMIDVLNVNRNTFDTRVRALRLKLRERLRRAGVIQ